MRLLSLIVLGLGGVAMLAALGTWQLHRLAWKTEILDRIETRIAAAPESLPEDFDIEADRYRPVEASGRTTGQEIHVLVSPRGMGPGYRVIAPLETAEGRRVLVDLGFVPDAAKTASRPARSLAVIGNLQWPREQDRFTPDPEVARNIWFARDVGLMAEALGTEPVLIVARELTPPVPGVTPLPVGTEGIPNDHLQYAITWFSLTAIWAGMTGLLGWRMVQRRV